mgnify:CR=1 FL=1
MLTRTSPVSAGWTMIRACCREMLAWSREVKSAVSLPLAVGFGISTPEMARAATRYADAAVVGSACVRIVERNGRSSRGPAELSRFVRSLKSALR